MTTRPASRRDGAFALLVLLVLSTGCSVPFFHPASPGDRFETYVSRYIDGTLSPNDDTPPDSPFPWLEARADSVRAIHAARELAELRTIDTTALTLPQRIDWLQIEASLKRELMDTTLHAAERQPERYITVGGVYWQSQSLSDSSVREWKNILSTLRKAPQALAIGRKQLSHPPELWVGLAARTCRRYEDFIRTTLAEKIRNSSPDTLKGKLDSASVAAARALKSYREFLTDTLAADSGSSWATGKAYYDWLLKEVHFLPYSSDSMIAIGWKMHNETKKLLEDFALKTGTGKTWKELVEEMKTHHPEPHKIADKYRSESDRVLALLREKNLIAIPPAETLIFVPTPLPLRETYAWGGYGGTTMKDGRSTGRFFVTDVTPDMSPDNVEEKLRTQNTGWITVIALHEGYPGHHLQQVYAETNPRKIRERLGSTYYAEGWALYCESWMGRNGFYLDRWDSLGWLQMRLWRTARVIIDPSIHTGKMTYEQAVNFFVDEVGLERSAAEAEVNRYTTWPTQAPSYIIGWREIENLKAEMAAVDWADKVNGLKFSERWFVESLLKEGSLPLELMKRAVRERMYTHAGGSIPEGTSP